MATESSVHEDVITDVLLSLKKNSGPELETQTVINELKEIIVESYSSGDSTRNFKGTWLKRIKNTAKSLNIALKNTTESWKENNQTLEELYAATNGISAGHNNSPVSPSTSSSSSSTLKSILTQKEREKLQQNFNRLTRLHKKDFWILDSTKEKAREDEVPPKSVEEKIMEFALSCHYYHPSQSLILDVNDKDWSAVFTDEELQEIRSIGDPISSSIPAEISNIFNETYKFKTPAEVFNMARRVELNPLEDHLKVWFTTELQNVASLFFPSGSYSILDCLEGGQTYVPFRIFKTVFQGTKITANGNEGSSKANAMGPITGRKMGRRVDTLFKSGTEELGCTEIGAGKDQTKQMEDSNFKMPLILRDMLLKLTYTKDLLHSVHTVGYDMTGGEVVLLDTDVPKGFVTRIRRTVPLEYPTSDENFVSRLLPLMNLALVGKALMENTITLVNSTPKPVTFDTDDYHWCLPPSMAPSSNTLSKRQRQA